jgi:hypothetical protein
MTAYIDYMKHGIIIFILLMNPAVIVSSSEKSDSPASVIEYIKIINHLEKVLNKTSPTLSDFKYFFPCECSEHEIIFEENYCIKVLKIDRKSKKCDEFAVNREKTPDRTPSLYLLNIKNILTNHHNDTIKLFIESSIQICSNVESNMDITIIAKIGNTNFKTIKLYMNCGTRQIGEESAFEGIEIDGKNLSDYPIEFDKSQK